MEFTGNLPEPKETFVVFLDSGLQTKFFPLHKPDEVTVSDSDPKDFHQAAERAERNFNCIPEESREALLALFSAKDDKSETPQSGAWGRYRFGTKSWTLPNGNQKTLDGIWLMIETNTSDGEGNASAGGVKYDRGTFYQTLALSEEEKTRIVEAYKEKKYRGGKQTIDGEVHYIAHTDGECFPMVIKHPGVSFGELKFELVVRKPEAATLDVDVILDLGNTRTAALLFEHPAADGRSLSTEFHAEDFSQKFKVLRLKPDHQSGEYDSMDEVSAGIADSWMVFHELEHQTFHQKDADTRPKLVQREVVAEKVEEKRTGIIFRKTEYEAKGYVVERIPQMFAASSPVLLGDAARRQFDFPYTRMLVEMGHVIQQSSPKRFYWDDQMRHQDWCMILNEWDPSRDDDPRDDPFPPVLQSEMLRFIDDNGKVVAMDRDLEPSERPTPYRDHPWFPRQSTLTWFLLHVLERAESQSNHTFVGHDFTPCRLRKVLMTYPSGWTGQEVARYRAQCQDALDIYSEMHVYQGKRGPLHLEMVAREMSPDEAVAGQLPFVFSEILRYKGQTATDWIQTLGKIRQSPEGGKGEATVRIMNFDIGGGTTDISVIEYKNLSSSPSLNRLSTRLLFRDGQTRAGDDLLKQIIETMILKPLIEQSRTVRVPGRKDETFADIIRNKFSSGAKHAKDSAVRSRVVRTCLIPLATYCLVHADKTEHFSAMDAGINENNWTEFVQQFLLDQNSDVPSPAVSPLPRDMKKFKTDNQVLNGLIHKTFAAMFRNSALYVAAFDVDLLVFSGKTSELNHIREMAEAEIPLPAERLIFARTFKPGSWYPFKDSNGYIRDAKTVTVVGAALYYALANHCISNWSIESEPSSAVGVNEWGELQAMRSPNRARQNVFLPADPAQDISDVVELMPNCIIARRQNACSAPEPVYKLINTPGEPMKGIVQFRLKRVYSEACGESLELLAPDEDKPLAGWELKLWPSSEGQDGIFWMESGEFRNIA